MFRMSGFLFSQTRTNTHTHTHSHLKHNSCVDAAFKTVSDLALQPSPANPFPLMRLHHQVSHRLLVYSLVLTFLCPTTYPSLSACLL